MTTKTPVYNDLEELQKGVQKVGLFPTIGLYGDQGENRKLKGVRNIKQAKDERDGCIDAEYFFMNNFITCNFHILAVVEIEKSKETVLVDIAIYLTEKRNELKQKLDEIEDTMEKLSSENQPKQ